jgi:hypothetical protein
VPIGACAALSDCSQVVRLRRSGPPAAPQVNAALIVEGLFGTGLSVSQKAAFYDSTGSRSMTIACSANPHNVLARNAFRDVVARYLQSGSMLLDFGCGTGLDAPAIRCRVYRVLAYDNSPGMVSRLDQRPARQR